MAGGGGALLLLLLLLLLSVQVLTNHESPSHSTVSETGEVDCIIASTIMATSILRLQIAANGEKSAPVAFARRMRQGSTDEIRMDVGRYLTNAPGKSLRAVAVKSEQPPYTNWGAVAAAAAAATTMVVVVLA